LKTPIISPLRLDHKANGISATVHVA
jgi:hypothetical protein